MMHVVKLNVLTMVQIREERWCLKYSHLLETLLTKLLQCTSALSDRQSSICIKRSNSYK